MKNTWHILGAGAIGSLFASALHRSGTPVILLQRPGARSSGPRTINIDAGNITTELSLPTSSNSDHELIQHVLVTTKSYDVDSALNEIAHRLTPEATVVILVNGMGFLKKIIPKFPNLKFTLGTTTEGAYRISEEHFCHAGSGNTWLGQAGSPAPPWFGDFKKVSLDCAWDTGIENRLWQKLAVNCAINPLTALEQCPNGKLAERANLAKKVDQLCCEIAEVSRHAGYKNTAANIHADVKEVIARTASNRSSMLQDRQARRRSENEYITGFLIREAKKWGLTIPYNTALYAAMREIDQAVV